MNCLQNPTRSYLHLTFILCIFQVIFYASTSANADTAHGNANPIPGASLNTSKKTNYSSFSRDQKLLIKWNPVPKPIPINQSFELKVLLFRGTGYSEPVAGATVYVRGWMPEHGHGMRRATRSQELEPGVYRVKGMLMHMIGSWQLSIDVVLPDGYSGTADYQVYLE